MVKLDKWNQFRNSRSFVVDNYIETKRTQFLIKWIIGHIVVNQSLGILMRAFKNALWQYDKKTTIAFVVLKVRQLWKHMVKRRGNLTK